MPSSAYRTGTDLTPRDPQSNSYCAEPKGSPIDVRGAQNAPVNGVPVIPSNQDVSANSGRSAQQLADDRATTSVPGVVGSPGVTVTSLGQLLGLPF
jgi:phospholipid/cholesterol/gamma-HCH transport system substrate-binding protein